jgi:hypothetical protein
VVTLELAGTGALGEAITRIQLLPGVVAATLVYHHYEDAAAPAGPPSPEPRPTRPSAPPTETTT